MKKTIHVNQLMKEITDLTRRMESFSYNHYGTCIEMCDFHYRKIESIIDLMKDFDLITVHCQNNLTELNINNMVARKRKLETMLNEGMLTND